MVTLKVLRNMIGKAREGPARHAGPILPVKRPMRITGHGVTARVVALAGGICSGRGRLSGNKEHLSHMLAAFQETMRRGGVTYGEGGGNGHGDGPAPDEIQ
jgi:hypothetical protein